MALEHPRLLAASLTAAFLGTSCSTPTESTPTGDAASNDSGMSGERMSGPPSMQEPGTGGAPQGTAEERARAERNKALVEFWMETADGLMKAGDADSLQGAKRELLKARDYAPGNERVMAMLEQVQMRLGEPIGNLNTFSQEQMRLREIAEQRALAVVRNQLQGARQRMAEKDYAGAIDELRRAELAIEIKDDADWQALPGEVAAAKAEAERLYDEQQRQQQERLSAELQAKLRRDYQEQQAQKRSRVDSLILQSQQAFTSRQYQHSQDLAQRALEVEPSNVLAMEMQMTAAKAARETANEGYLQARAQEIRKMLQAHEELKVPQTATLALDTEVWAQAQKRARRGTSAQPLEPQDLALQNQVAALPVGRLTFTEETGDYLDVLKQLSLNTGVQIITTPEAREAISSEGLKLVVELASSISLKNMLDQMVGRSASLAWTVKNGVVVVGNKSQAAGTLATELYSVQDLIFPQREFFPPFIEGIPNEESSDEPRTGYEGDDEVISFDPGDIQNTLMDATGREYWEAGDGPEIRVEDTGFLTITASPQKHSEVQKVLEDMRRYQTPIVTIDSKFLTISRNFLQQIGVDFRGLGGSGNKGSVVSLEDVTNGLVNNASRGNDNGGTGDPAANPLAGAFYNDGSDGDVRARTENFFLQDLGKALSVNGGLTAGWTVLDDTQLSMILQAVEKRQDGELVNSQILSVMNKSRGHVAVINQTAYVRDFDVEVAQLAFIADPKVDVIQDGIVLDVKPFIQNDRKYIILDLDPTVAELQRPIPTFTTSLAGSTLPVTIQLPRLTVTRFRTTAKVPDGGSLLLGGLRQVLTKERTATVPLLGQLPLISFLFRQEGSADENRSLMVMVRAQISDVIDRAR